MNSSMLLLLLLLGLVTSVKGFVGPLTTTTTTSSTTKCKALAFLSDAGSAAAAISSFYETQPYVAAFLTCSFKASAADIVAQTSQGEEQQEQQHPASDEASIMSKAKTLTRANGDLTNNNSELDVSRNLGYLVYGGLYQGLAQQCMYTALFPSLFGSDGSWQSVFGQVAFDMAFIGPFVCLPIAYIVKAAFAMSSSSSSSSATTAVAATTTKGIQQEVEHSASPLLLPPLLDDTTWIQDSLSKYWKDVTQRSLLLKYWALWIPVQALNFSVIPPHFRVAFVAAVSFFWVIILSSTAAASSESDESSNQTDASSLKLPQLLPNKSISLEDRIQQNSTR